MKQYDFMDTFIWMLWRSSYLYICEVWFFPMNSASRLIYITTGINCIFNLLEINFDKIYFSMHSQVVLMLLHKWKIKNNQQASCNMIRHGFTATTFAKAENTAVQGQACKILPTREFLFISAENFWSYVFEIQLIEFRD